MNHCPLHQLCRLACGASLLLAALPAFADPPATRPAEEIQAAILQLADPNPQVREDASRALWRMGQAAEPALQRVAKLPDPELSGRAKQILLDFQYGIYPDTPADIVGLVRICQGGNAAAKQEAVGTLAQMGSRAMPYLVRLSKAEPDETFRKEIFQRLAMRATESVPAFLVDGDSATALRVLEMAAASGTDEGARSLAAYLLLTGGIDARIEKLQQQIKADVEVAGASHLLAQCLRAKGDLPEARKLAEETGRDELLDTLLAQQGDFAALAKRYAGEANNPVPDIELLGLLSMSQRLAGDAPGLERTLRTVAELPTRRMEPEMPPLCAEVLLLNGRPDLAIPVLIKGKEFEKAFDLLAGQQRYREALTLAEGLGDDVRLTIHEPVFSAKANAARVLCFLGETEQGTALFDKLAGQLEGNPAVRQRCALIEAARQARQYERALQYCAAGLRGEKEEPSQAMLLMSLYDEKADQALTWHGFLRQQRPEGPPLELLRSVSRILTGGLPMAELEDLSRRAARGEGLADAGERAARVRGVAQTLESAGRLDLAAELLQKPAEGSESPDEYMLLGGLALKQEKWTAAAEHYASASAKDPSRAAPLWLRGHALIKSGRAEEGRKLIELADLLPLADPHHRYELAEALRKAGLADDAEKQYELVVRTGRWMTSEMGNALRQLGRYCQRRGDWKQAARHLQLSIFDCLEVQIQYTEFSSYLGAPATIHRIRAAGLLQEGKPDAALAEIEQSLRILPGEIMTAIDLHPLLVKAGRPEDAAKLVDRILGYNEAALKDYPRSAALHNAIAWMLARCGRNMDTALDHAKKGVEIEPKNLAILDTLAEVYFQLGQKDNAIATIRQCMELEPQNPRHKLALARFETSTPDTEPPEE